MGRAEHSKCERWIIECSLEGFKSFNLGIYLHLYLQHFWDKENILIDKYIFAMHKILQICLLASHSRRTLPFRRHKQSTHLT